MPESITTMEGAAVAEIFPPAVLGRGYSNNELRLIKAIWTDTKQVAQQKMQLCLHLYELKQEMDANDPSAGSGNNGQSRFWAAFEQGDLPEYVVNNRKRAEEWLTAAAFAASGEFPGASGDSLLVLTPSTVCNLARINNPKAKAIAEQHLQTHEFIGHDAASYLAKTTLDSDVLDELANWIKENDTKALVPSVIRKLETQVELNRRPASTQTIDVDTAERQAAAFEKIMADLDQRAPEIAAENTERAVREELNRPSRERLQKLEEEVRRYNSKLNAAASAMQDLLDCLVAIDRIYGTQYLDEMRTVEIMGLVTVQDDISRIKKIGRDLFAAVKLANSSKPPSGIDMTTLDVDQL